MENIHLKPQISVLGISSPAGWLADLTWKYLDQSVMIDVDQRQCETMTRLMRRAVWPADPATLLSTQTTGSPHS